MDYGIKGLEHKNFNLLKTSITIQNVITVEYDYLILLWLHKLKSYRDYTKQNDFLQLFTFYKRVKLRIVL
jgi:hypothetical protein